MKWGKDTQQAASFNNRLCCGHASAVCCAVLCCTLTMQAACLQVSTRAPQAGYQLNHATRAPLHG